MKGQTRIAARMQSGALNAVARSAAESRPGLVHFLTVAAALTSSWSAVRVGGVAFADVFLVLGALAALLFSGPRIALVKSWMVLPVLLALFLVARDVVIFGRPLDGDLTTIEGVSPSQMLLRIVLSTFCVAVLCVANTAYGKRGVQRLVGWWLAGVAVSAAYALGQSAGFFAVDELVQLNGSSRFAGLTSHPNALAQTLVLAIPFALLVPPKLRITSLLARVLGLALWGAALYQSGSRPASWSGSELCWSAVASLPLVPTLYGSSCRSFCSHRPSRFFTVLGSSRARDSHPIPVPPRAILHVSRP